MSKTTTVTLEIEPKLKNDVESILDKLGLTAPQAVTLLYRQIQLQQGLPFDVRIPNKLTAKTLAESRGGKNVRHFRTKEELYTDLGL